MAYSRIQIPGNGTNGPFTVSFALGYLSQSEVTARVNAEVDGLGAPLYRTITWLDVELVNISGVAPTGSDIITFDRTTSKTTLKHDFNDGAPITETNLDESHKQAIMVAHEALDGRFGALQTDLDAGNHHIINVLDPVGAQDAATKAYVDLQVISSGNVIAPTAPEVGKVLTATGVGTWAWGTPVTVPNATDAVRGIVELTSDAEADAGVIADRIMTLVQTVARYARKAVANTFTAVQTIVRPGNSQAASFESESANNAVGVSIDLYHNKSVAGAVDDALGRLFFYGKNNAGSPAKTLYTWIDSTIGSAVAGAQTGVGHLSAFITGGANSVLRWSTGVVVGNPSGLFKGLGTINTTGYYWQGIGVAGGLVRAEFQTTAGAASLGGASTVANTWTKIPLNNAVQNDISAGFASNQITLTAGRYRIRARQTFFTRNGRCRVQNITDGATAQYGTFAGAGGVAQNLESFVDGIDYVIAGTKVFELQYYQVLATANGLGGIVTGGTPASNVEHWGYVEFEKVE